MQNYLQTYFTTADQIKSFHNALPAIYNENSRIHLKWLQQQPIGDLRDYCDRLIASLDGRNLPEYVFSSKPKLNTKAGVIDYIYDLYARYYA